MHLNNGSPKIVYFARKNIEIICGTIKTVKTLNWKTERNLRLILSLMVHHVRLLTRENFLFFLIIVVGSEQAWYHVFIVVIVFRRPNRSDVAEVWLVSEIENVEPWPWSHLFATWPTHASYHVLRNYIKCQKELWKPEGKLASGPLELATMSL